MTRFLPLIWQGLTRRKTRTLFAGAVIALTFVLFSFLMAFDRAMSLGVDWADADKLVILHRTSPVETLPLSYVGDLQSLPGIRLVSHRTWFGGYFREISNQRPVWAVDPARFLAFYPNLEFPAESEKAAFLAGGNAIAVGVPVAREFGWKVGDRVPLKSYIWTSTGGGNTWYFTVAALFDSRDPGADTAQVLIPFAPFDQTRSFGRGSVGIIEVALSKGTDAAAMVRQIDNRYFNSAKPTRTSTLKGYLQSFSAQIGKISSLVRGILSVVVFTTMVLLASNFIHSFVERRAELAVLKTLGFSSRLLLVLILIEAVILVGGFGLLGLLAGRSLVGMAATAVADFLPGLRLLNRDFLLGVGLMLGLALVTALWPAIQAARLGITAGLRGRI
ncbi:MAG: putative transport system permease protein [Thermoanaerobaculia bacterium]|jgi:putative ABC transport system permease protein|nr:putative transport system permease protein [Thermoanaerobaculia bacterium]MEA2416087.1 putative transport system permease protein [Thermoanaerobaculia bacterium]